MGFHVATATRALNLLFSLLLDYFCINLMSKLMPLVYLVFFSDFLNAESVDCFCLNYYLLHSRNSFFLIIHLTPESCSIDSD